MSKEVKYLKSPLGLLKITVKHDKLKSIKYTDQTKKEYNKEIKSKAMEDTLIQFKQYFKGQRKNFTVPFYLTGTDFQQDVYKALLEVDYGQVITYKELAAAAGHDKAYQAVGTAMRNNRLPIIIPCHRVVKTDNSLGNYTGGKWRKEKLLQIENSVFF